MFKLMRKGLKVIWQGFQLQGMEQAGEWTAAQELRETFDAEWSKQC